MKTGWSDETLAVPDTASPWVTLRGPPQLVITAAAGAATASSATVAANTLSASANTTGGRHNVSLRIVM